MTSADASTPVLQLHDFVGDWNDSMGNMVVVTWPYYRNPAGGDLDVELIRKRSSFRLGQDAVRLNVKFMGNGRFQCGHFDIELDKSSANKIVWVDRRKKGRQSTWSRDGTGTERDGRSRSPQRRSSCGCVLKTRIALRCVHHMPPGSVLQGITTPGAWAPPSAPSTSVDTPPPKLECVDRWNATSSAPWSLVSADSTAETSQAPSKSLPSVKPEAAPKLLNKESETDRALEAYEESLVKEDTALRTDLSQMPTDVAILQEAKEKLLQKLKLVPEMLHKGNAKTRRNTLKGAPQDPRMRRALLAPSGGA